MPIPVPLEIECLRYIGVRVHAVQALLTAVFRMKSSEMFHSSANEDTSRVMQILDQIKSEQMGKQASQASKQSQELVNSNPDSDPDPT